VESFISSLGQVSAIIGAQWGDEGKGKVTDIASESFDIIARACGGANAGHTIVVDGTQHVFHLLPSGCLHEGKPVVIGSGMVVHLPTLSEEIQTLKKTGIDIVPRLYISSEAHILFMYHQELDTVVRSGMRMAQLKENISDELEERAQTLLDTYGLSVDVSLELKQLEAAKEAVGSCICDTVELLHCFLADGKTILIEGAQGTLLDLDHGSYPYVTSSSTTASGALQGLGLPPNVLSSCIGVAKAYCTRVGEGDFLTEAKGEVADRLRERGGEYGATTGRPRRCGWLHLPDLRKSVRLNGYTHWNITKLDVLDEEEVIPVGVDEKDGTVIYEELPGWMESTAGLHSYESLPQNAKRYIEWIEEKTGVAVALIGTGQGREAMIVKSS